MVTLSTCGNNPVTYGTGTFNQVIWHCFKIASFKILIRLIPSSSRTDTQLKSRQFYWFDRSQNSKKERRIWLIN